MVCEQITLDLHDLKISALRFGQGGPPILALHGWLDNAASFMPIATYLTDYDLIAIDFPGHGHSDHLPKHAIYHFIDAVHYIALCQENLKLDTIHLLGHSMGGAIACLYAACFPHRVNKLIVIEGLGPLSAEIDETVAQVVNFHRRCEETLPSNPRTYPSIEAGARARAHKGHIQFEQAIILAERGMKPCYGGYQWRHDPKLYLPSPLKLTEEQVLRFLCAIESPTLSITGTHGFDYCQHKFEKRTKSIQNLSSQSFAGGHHLHMENAQKIAEEVFRFLTNE